MTDEDLANEVFRMDFYIRRNTRYHMRRAAFFAFLSRSTAFVGVVFGSAAAATLLTESAPWITGVLALFVAVFSALDLVIGTSARAWLHNDLRRRYIEIDAALTEIGSPNIGHLNALWGRIKRIEADEPPVMHALEVLAHDDAVRSVFTRDEAKEHLSTLGWFKRMTAQLWPWDTSKV